MSEPADTQRCELCHVAIEARTGLPDVVQFSNGPTGSRSKLWSRVCQFVTDPERQQLCINRDGGQSDLAQPGDAYPDAPTIDLAKG